MTELHRLKWRFWAKTELSSTGCILWTGTLGGVKKKRTDGYGLFKIRRRWQRAHRVVWEFVNGPIPEGLVVRHKCDVRVCVNPEHLELGTVRENNNDIVIRGRHKRGSQVWNARLDESRVAVVKAKLNAGEKRYAVAKWAGVCFKTINDIYVGKTWKHVDPAVAVT